MQCQIIRYVMSGIICTCTLHAINTMVSTALSVPTKHKMSDHNVTVTVTV